jgi:hypothetical protein
MLDITHYPLYLLYKKTISKTSPVDNQITESGRISEKIAQHFAQMVDDGLLQPHHAHLPIENLAYLR